MANLTQAKLDDFVSKTQDQLLKLFDNELVFGKYLNVNRQFDHLYSSKLLVVLLPIIDYFII